MQMGVGRGCAAAGLRRAILPSFGLVNTARRLRGKDRKEKERS